MRLFLAIELPDAWRHEAAAVRQRLQARLGEDAGLRFTTTDRLHLTLRFLGSVDDALVPRLDTHLTAQLPTVEAALTLAAPGTFGSHSLPTVVWLGLDGQLAALDTLRAAIDRAVAATPLEADDRPLRPHITLARVHRGASPPQRRAISDAVAALPPPAPTPFVAHQVALVRSHLGRNARYEALSRYP